uniref:uncharacterized protein LOC122604452 n=1 Tax=Erigeron canadensis TaxID=72917 RepID=UPI001CB8FCCF|nr:uncharacterized protein LOC122604452 [Erigeron canadensis]
MDTSGPSSSNAVIEEVSEKLKNTYDNSLTPMVVGAGANTTNISIPEKEIGGGSHQFTPDTSQVPTYNGTGVSQQYNPHPSHFVSIKLSSQTNYKLWKKQMMCLLEYHDMLSYVHHGTINPMDQWNKSKDTLVKGWIFGTLSEDVLTTVLDLDNAYTVWEKLKLIYDNSLMPTVVAAGVFTTNISIPVDPTEIALAEYIPLNRAILSGDWKNAQEFFEKEPASLTAKITREGDSPLQIAVVTCHDNPGFVENLVKLIDAESLRSDMCYNEGTVLNVLHRAAIVGNTEAAKILVEKNPSLLFIVDGQGYLPIARAIYSYKTSTSLYLFEACKIHKYIAKSNGYINPFEGVHGLMILSGVIALGLLDIALELIKDYPDLAKTKDFTSLYSPLNCIVNKRDGYYSATRYNFYQRFVYSSCVVMRRIYVYIWKAALSHVPHIKCLLEDKLKHQKCMKILERLCDNVSEIKNAADILYHIGLPFNTAVANDIPEAVATIVRFFPQALWTCHTNGFYIQYVVRYRCEKVLNYLEDRVNGSINLLRAAIDSNGNNILHLAGELAPIDKLNMVSGAALQMQREVQWFKKIEKFVLPIAKETPNKNLDTPIEVFRKEHMTLKKEGEEWLKKTADSYTITAALIITIVFAAAITVPGGNDDKTGKPNFETNVGFLIFAFSDAISLFTSTTSLLLFLSILTARYHEDDFLNNLPKRLIFGLMMLFFSVTSMMVAFSATLYIMFGQGNTWILIPIAALTCLPIATYVILQFPLLVELTSSTYGRGIYRKSGYSKNK